MSRFFQKFSLNLVVNMVFFKRVGGEELGYGCAAYKFGSGVHKK